MKQYKSRRRFALLFHDHNKTGLALLKVAIRDCDKLYSLQESHREYPISGQRVNNRYHKIGKGIHLICMVS
jgi:hypothetical protein